MVTRLEPPVRVSVYTGRLPIRERWMWKPSDDEVATPSTSGGSMLAAVASGRPVDFPAAPRSKYSSGVARTSRRCANRREAEARQLVMALPSS
eukprot:CAMPEP_0115863772 /NCGR_PEP_ID=MMETSP0287-20121206/18857_1 /TAXON_ID=412157 /ORGANISM="Chrysochromulina rotalis, Strain UIO044" /LENGTH=92 /DNA_ID=CAMNT_0003318221 /DNA_START=495 /DNA_END=770 /DNA_ORIENTATION=+